MKKTVLTLVTFAAALGASHSAQAVIPHFEGFEDLGWTPGGDNWNNNVGVINQVGSGAGSLGLSSADGNGHAEVTGKGPFTRFGGYASEFVDGLKAVVDIYIDTTWGIGEGFDYTVAVSNQANGHLRDFIWHVGVVENASSSNFGKLLVNASNNTDGVVNDYKLENNNGGNYATLTDSGWYTFEHVFRNDGGVLAVDMNLYDDGGSLLLSNTRSDGGDLIDTVVGGHRYGWFTANDVNGSVAIDNTMIMGPASVPDSGTTATILGVALLALAGIRRRMR